MGSRQARPGVVSSAWMRPKPHWLTVVTASRIMVSSCMKRIPPGAFHPAAPAFRGSMACLAQVARRESSEAQNWNCRCRIRALSDKDLERRGITPDQGKGNLKAYSPEAQGYRQPQAGYIDPLAGTETRTDVGWGYDRKVGWEPDPGRYDPGLRGLVDDVYKLKKLAQSTDVNSENPLDIRCKDMLMNMATMASVASGIQDRFIGLWKSRGDYEKHLAKRQREQAVMSGADYAAKTFKVIAQAERMMLAVASNDFATGKLEIEADGWIVLVGNDGHIVTSYRYLPNKLEFLARHREAGDIIHEYRLDEELRKLLESVFNRP